MKISCSKCYKMLLKEILKPKWMEDIPCSRTERFNIVKIAILPKAIYKFDILPPIKIPFFQIWKSQPSNSYGIVKGHKELKLPWKRRIKLEDSYYLLPRLTKNCIKHNGMVLANRYIQRSTEQDREYRNRLMWWSIEFC